MYVTNQHILYGGVYFVGVCPHRGTTESIVNTPASKAVQQDHHKSAVPYIALASHSRRGVGISAIAEVLGAPVKPPLIAEVLGAPVARAPAKPAIAGSAPAPHDYPIHGHA